MRALAWLAPLTLLIVTGCGGDPRDAADPSSPTTSSSAAPSPDETTTPSDEPALPDVVELSGKQMAGFTAQDGAIACLFDSYSAAEAVRCDVLENSWTPPSAPADCQGDWGLAVGLTADGSPGTFLCVSDTVVGIRGQTDGRRELPANTLVAYRDLACLVQENGVSCYDTTSGEHSIFVTPLTYEVI
ncbi:MAG: hypothetical protein KDB63_00645 [Nocardioidaceae bacterium]|nr:hypothetical protein [Nocardioidaceae bacterium]